MRNVIFSIMVCIVIAGPVALYFTQNIVGVKVPDWVSSENAKYLLGDVSEAHVKANLNLTGFRSERLQSALQAEIGNHIPLKATILLNNAALQRTFIAVSSELFGWDCYPTYFGSDEIYVSDHDALSYIPDERVVEWLERAKTFSLELSKFAEEHPDIEFRVVIPDTLHTSRANPVMDLVSRSIHIEDFVDVMRAPCSSLRNVTVSSKAYADFDAYLSDFYATDGHWNGWGAIAAYDELLVETDQIHGRYAGVADSALMDRALIYNGQSSRAGLMLLNERVDEPAMRLAGLSVEDGASGYLLLEDGAQALSEAGLYGEYNFYALWYGGDVPAIIVSDDTDKGNALIVSDSFGDPFRWIIASDHCRTYSVMDLHGASKDDMTLIDRLNMSDADVVYFVGSPFDFATFSERHESYFD